MSADKHKKKDRAYAFIRSLRQGYRSYPKGEAKMNVSGDHSGVIRYCLERGLATLRRVRRSGATNRRNVFSAD